MSMHQLDIKLHKLLLAINDFIVYKMPRESEKLF